MRKKICVMIAAVLCIITVCSTTIENSFAASKRTKNQKITYQNIIKQWIKEAKKEGGHRDQIYFSVDDINCDGTKELVISNYVGVGSADWFSSIYNKNGKCIKTSTYKNSYAKAKKSFDHIYGNLALMKYKKGIICYGERFPTGTGETYYKIQKNGKFKELAHYDCFHYDDEGNQLDYYSVKGTKVSKTTYDKKIKSFGQGKNLKEYSATKKNINRILGY